MKKIPLLDLSRQHSTLKERILQKIGEIIDSNRYILGNEVKELEDRIASYVHTKFAIGVASGSDALFLSLLALDIGPGEGVFVPSYTFFATAGAVARTGATPIFIDIDYESYNIDPGKLEEYIEKNCEVTYKGLYDKKFKVIIRAIIPVHLFGQTAEMEPIIHLAKKYNLKIVEDAAQSLGAEYQGEKVGSIGTMGIYSFFPSKNLGGMGDGGMVVTDSAELADKVRILRVHGSKPKYFHKLVGINSRLDTIQAAVLLIKFEYLEEWIEKRRKTAHLYKRLFKEKGLGCEGKDSKCKVKLPMECPYSRHTYNQFIVRVKDRDDLKNFLQENGVGTGIYYPHPLHLQEAFSHLGYRKGDLPESEKAAKETIAIPCFPGMKEEEVEYVVDLIAKFYHK